MVIVFGGTTEGRKAVEVLEQGTAPYYYSTRDSLQSVEQRHGIRLTGDMDVHQMLAFCREHSIRLIIDAAHPFAEELHRNLLYVARHTEAALIRFERLYPPRTLDLHWCRDYDDAIRQMKDAGIDRLLMLTGVQTIGHMRRFWEQHECWCRILNRRISHLIAQKNRFPEDHLIEVKEELSSITSALPSLLDTLHPDAILTKESGQSGGFPEKVRAARDAGVEVFVIERPVYPPHTPVLQAVNLQVVNGPYGLRRAIEQVLPTFFPLRTGLTTGTWATVAVKAAMLALLGEDSEATEVCLPDGETIPAPVGDVETGGSGTARWAEATVTKDASDDPDVTRGCRITAHVAFSPEAGSGVRFLQGEGVGRVTLPGLGIEVGGPAINPVPRQMMTAAVRTLTPADVDITLNVENGRELARRTFNERVGVQDGISIIGTSGIVQPLSNEAFVQSIGREMEVARAMGCESIGLASGKQGEAALLQQEPTLRVIHYGNFIGAALSRAHALGFQRAVVGIMIGKAVKLAEGHLDTHSHKVLMNKDFLLSVAKDVGVEDAATRLNDLQMARELWHIMPPAFFQRLHDLCLQHCRTVFPTGNLEVWINPDPSPDSSLTKP